MAARTQPAVSRIEVVSDVLFVTTDSSSEIKAPGRGRRYTAEEIGRLLAEAARPGVRLRQVLARHRVSAKTYYLWKARFGGLHAAERRRVQHLEREAVLLRRRLDRASEDLKMLQRFVKGLVRSREARRDAVKSLRQTNSISDRRAYAVLGAARPWSARGARGG